MNMQRVHFDGHSFLDIGNSTVVLKDYDESTGQFVHTRRFLTKYFQVPQLVPYLKNTQYLYFSSVVPALTTGLTQLQQQLQIPFYNIVDIETGHLKLKIANTQGIGGDLIAQAQGAIRLHGSDLAIVSLGTATTIVHINSDCEFLGGMIMPSLRMQINSLHDYTAGLPYIKNIPTTMPVGEWYYLNTEKAMISGCLCLNYYGLKSVINEIKQQYPNRKIVGTGGMSLYFQDLFDIWEPDLLFFGLLSLYNKIKKNEDEDKQ